MHSLIRKVGLLSFFALIFFPRIAHSADQHAIQIKGSDTMVNLGQAWAEEYMRQHPETTIAVTGGGSGTGIAAIIGGTCDIAQASREMTPSELEKAKAAGREVEETIVGYDGLAVIVNPGNPIQNVTIDQLADIFTGKVANWKELGGKNLPILVLSRERNSGTHVFFLEHILRKGNAKGPEEYASSALMMPSSQAIVQETQSSEAAIGYVGHGYVNPQVKVLAVGKTAAGPFIMPSIETVQSGEYPVARPLYFYTQKSSRSVLQSFIDFVLSAEGQEIVKMLDFVPKK